VSEAVRTRIGGHVVVDALEALGAETAFGLPGVAAAVAGLEFCCTVSIFLVQSSRLGAVTSFLRRRG